MASPDRIGFHLRLTPHEYALVRHMATHERRSATGMIRQAIAEAAERRSLPSLSEYPANEIAPDETDFSL